MKRLLLAFTLLAAVKAEVADSSPSGFTLKQSWTIPGTPDSVYKSFLSIADWWSPTQSWSGDAHNLYIEPKINGCFCEHLPSARSGVRHMEIVYLDPGKLLRITGGLGPLQALSVNGAMTVQFGKFDEQSTKVDVTYAVGGYMDKGLDKIAPSVDSVLREQFVRFKTLLDAGGKK